MSKSLLLILSTLILSSCIFEKKKWDFDFQQPQNGATVNTNKVSVWGNLSLITAKITKAQKRKLKKQWKALSATQKEEVQNKYQAYLNSNTGNKSFLDWLFGIPPLSGAMIYCNGVRGKIFDYEGTGGWQVYDLPLNPGANTLRCAFSDGDGTRTKLLTVNYQPNNQNPVANFTASTTSGPAPLSVSFNGNSSTDANDHIVSYSWNFGDNTTASGSTVQHTFVQAQNFRVVLTVKDSFGAIGTKEMIISATGAVNLPPVAKFAVDFNSGVRPLAVNFDAAQSVDADGTIVSYEWKFGDSQVATGVRVNHIYATTGIFTAELKVTDNKGATNISTQIINVRDPENVIPVANFSISPTMGDAPLATTLDASMSVDSDGSIVEYQFNFGDGEVLSSTSPVVSHTFQSVGNFTVSLIVKDNNGALSVAKTSEVTVTQPIPHGIVSGIAFIERVGGAESYPVTLTFQSGAVYTTQTNSDGSFAIAPTLDGPFTIEVNDGIYKGTVSGILDTNHQSFEEAVILKKFGVGKFSGTTLSGTTGIAIPNVSLVLHSFDDSFEASVVSDSTGVFTFDNLPLLGRFYFTAFNEQGQYINGAILFTSSQPETLNFNVPLYDLPAYPYLQNGSFAYGSFSSWFGLNESKIVPQTDVFSTPVNELAFFGDTQPRPIYNPEANRDLNTEITPPPPRTHSILTSPESFRIGTIDQLPCENKNFAGFVSNTIQTQGLLEQYITIEPDADTLIMRVKFLTNESMEAALLGYNDTFLITLSNPLKSIFIKIGEIKGQNWHSGRMGFLYETDEFDIAVDVRHLQNKKGKLSFIVVDRGDSFGDSAIVFSNLQMVKANEKNFVEQGTWSNDTAYTQNLGEVNWVTLKNQGSLTTAKLNNQSFLFKPNTEVLVPSVKFGNVPQSLTFNIDMLKSTDIFGYKVESNWVSSMPSQNCGNGVDL